MTNIGRLRTVLRQSTHMWLVGLLAISVTTACTSDSTPELASTLVATATPTAEPAPTQTATATPTAEPTPTQTATVVPTPEPTPTQIATAAPTPEPTSTQTATAAPTSEPTPTQIATAAPTPEPTPTQVSTVAFGPGTYQVGGDISVGTYAGRAGLGALDSCAWERLSGVSGEFSDIIAIEIANGQFYVEILDTDKYFRTSCVVTSLDEWPVPDEPSSMIEVGTHIVGRDIPPGTFAGRAGLGVLDSCAWERLSGVSGEFSDIIAIEIANGQFYVEILDTDKYFRTSCVVTSLDEWPVPDEPSSTIEIGTYIVGRDC